MTGEQNIAGLLDTAMEKLNGMVQVNTVVGAPIFAGDTTIIPISKVSLGFVAGGGEYGQKHSQQPTLLLAAALAAAWQFPRWAF